MSRAPSEYGVVQAREWMEKNVTPQIVTSFQRGKQEMEETTLLLMCQLLLPSLYLIIPIDSQAPDVVKKPLFLSVMRAHGSSLLRLIVYPSISSSCFIGDTMQLV
jgi:hypothetical protein